MGPKMDVIIVGAGITGLATYLSLKKRWPEMNVKIYESHAPDSVVHPDTLDLDELSSSTTVVGGGLGIAPNGMRVIREIDDKLYKAIKSRGFTCENFTFKSARGWTMAMQPIGDQKQPEEHCVSIMRHEVLNCFREFVGPGVIEYRKVIGLRTNAAGRPAIVLEGGEAAEPTEHEADLIIGADGVKSTVREAMFDGQYPPVYEGLIGVGGFIAQDPPAEVLRDKSMVFTFGPNGFFGYGAVSPQSAMWWSTCEAPCPPREKLQVDADKMRTQLKKRHGWWKDPVIKSIIDDVHVEHVWPTWTVPPLPHWGKDGVVLIGDAAHALQPTSGQGSSQGFEDAKTLVLCLQKHLEGCHDPALNDTPDGTDNPSIADAVRKATALYFAVRSPRVDKIVQRTAQMASSKKEQGFVQEMFVCGFFWLLGKIPSLSKSMMGNINTWDAEAEIERLSEAD